jgi:hypothetical protein
MNDRLQELLESWINGNRRDVADELSRGPRGDVAEFTAALYRAAGAGDTLAFSRMIRNRD